MAAPQVREHGLYVAELQVEQATRNGLTDKKEADA